MKRKIQTALAAIVFALIVWLMFSVDSSFAGSLQAWGGLLVIVLGFLAINHLVDAAFDNEPKENLSAKPVVSWTIKPCPDCGDQVAMSAYDGQPTPDGIPGYVFRCACGHRFDAWDYRTHVTSEKAIRKWNHHSSTYAKGAAIEKAGLSAWSKKPPANQLKSR